MKHEDLMPPGGPGSRLARLAALACVALSASVSAGTVTCESSHEHYKFCRTNTYGGVQLETQLSHSPCRRGSTWGVEDKGIWVSNGCRAVFHTGAHADYGYDRDDDDHDKAAAAVAGIALLALGAAAAHKAHEDHHDSRDYDYQSYRYDDSHQSYHYDRHRRNQQVLCESNKDRYNYCKVNTRGAQVNILRKHSRSGCRFHEDWGYNTSGIWVDNGCRATFEVVY